MSAWSPRGEEGAAKDGSSERGVRAGEGWGAGPVGRRAREGCPSPGVVSRAFCVRSVKESCYGKEGRKAKAILSDRAGI